MKKPDTIEQEVNKIRLAIYEETKDMTLEERKEYWHMKTDPIIKKYGFKVIPSAGSRPAAL